MHPEFLAQAAGRSAELAHWLPGSYAGDRAAVNAWASVLQRFCCLADRIIVVLRAAVYARTAFRPGLSITNHYTMGGYIGNIYIVYSGFIF